MPDIGREEPVWRDPIDAYRERASGAEAGKRGNGDMAPASGHEIPSEGMEML